jgi:type II secretory pathway component PulM
MFQIERLGGRFVLAALAVPEAALPQSRALVNAFPEVAHNYRRTTAQHVVRARHRNPRGIADVIRRIEAATGLPVFRLSQAPEFFVDMRLQA